MSDYEKEDSPEGENKCYRDIIINTLISLDIVKFHSRKYAKLYSVLMNDPLPGEFVAWETRDLVNDFVLDVGETNSTLNITDPIMKEHLVAMTKYKFHGDKAKSLAWLLSNHFSIESSNEIIEAIQEQMKNEA